MKTGNRVFGDIKKGCQSKVMFGKEEKEIFQWESRVVEGFLGKVDRIKGKLFGKEGVEAIRGKKRELITRQNHLLGRTALVKDIMFKIDNGHDMGKYGRLLLEIKKLKCG